MELTPEKLEEMKRIDLKTVDIDLLTDIRDIEIDAKKSVNRKIETLAEQTDNLYLYRFGDYIVKLKYQESGPTINDKMRDYVRQLAKEFI